MSVGNDRFDAFQAMALELAQGVGPKEPVPDPDPGFSFRRADIHAENFTLPRLTRLMLQLKYG